MQRWSWQKLGGVCIGWLDGFEIPDITKVLEFCPQQEDYRPFLSTPIIKLRMLGTF